MNTAGVSWGLYFFFYNNAKSRWMSRMEQDNLFSAPINLISGLEAGSLVSVRQKLSPMLSTASPC